MTQEAIRAALVHHKQPDVTIGTIHEGVAVPEDSESPDLRGRLATWLLDQLGPPKGEHAINRVISPLGCVGVLAVMSASVSMAERGVPLPGVLAPADVLGGDMTTDEKTSFLLKLVEDATGGDFALELHDLALASGLVNTEHPPVTAPSTF